MPKECSVGVVTGHVDLPQLWSRHKVRLLESQPHARFNMELVTSCFIVRTLIYPSVPVADMTKYPPKLALDSLTVEILHAKCFEVENRLPRAEGRRV